MTTNDILEYTGIFFGLVFVVLESRNNILCWPAGIIQSILGIILMYHQKLYSESILYAFYVVTGIIGWYRWHRQESSNGNVREWRINRHLIMLISGALLSFLLYYIFDTFTDADKTALDSITTGFSIIATILLIERILSTWYYWIILNGLTIYLYASKGMEFYAGYFVLMTIISVYGLIRWRNIYNQSKLS